MSLVAALLGLGLSLVAPMSGAEPAPPAVPDAVDPAQAVDPGNAPPAAGCGEESEGEPCGDVAVTTTAVSSPVSAEEDAVWTITVTNRSEGPASSVWLFDRIPSELGNPQFGGPDAGACTRNRWSVSCDFGTLAGDDGSPGGADTRVVTVSGRTDAADCGTVTNTATVRSSEQGTPYLDTDMENNAASASVVVDCPDLVIDKSAPSATVEAGDPIVFDIVVTNMGPGTAFGTTVADSLPHGVGVFWSEEHETCAIRDNRLSCRLGHLVAGDSVALRVTGTTGDKSCKTYDNEAYAIAVNHPYVEDEAEVEVLCPLGISLVKDGPDLAHRGDEVTYTFTVTNSGAAELTGIELTDPLCDAGTLSLVDDADGDATLAIDEVWTYECTRVITDSDPDPLPNTATVVGSDVHGRVVQADGDHPVEIIDPAVELAKGVDDATPAVGQTVTFSYDVTNTGDTELFDVEVTDDQLGPVGTITELGVGASVTLTMDMLVAADSPGRNVATVVGADVLGKSVTDEDAVTITIVQASAIPPVVIDVDPSTLPRTGAESVRSVAIGLVLLAVGALCLAASDRRERSVGR